MKEQKLLSRRELQSLLDRKAYIDGQIIIPG
jgi:hypothetical protein